MALPEPGAPARGLLRSAGPPLLALALDALLLSIGLGGWPMLLGTPTALALMFVWGAAGLVLAWLRPVRAIGHSVRRPDPLVMAALFVLPLVTPMVAAWGGRWDLAPLPAGIRWGPLGVALVAAALALRIAAMAQLGSRFSPFIAVQHEHALETRGLYARMRHPGYAGSLLACLGAAIAFGSGAALPLVLAMLVVASVRIRAEEQLLAERFGEGWTRYARHTWALFPRIGRTGP